MESTLSATTLFSLTKTLNPSSKPLASHLHNNFSRSVLHQSLQNRRIKCISNGDFHKSFDFTSSSSSPAISLRLACVSSSTALFASGGGNDGFSSGDGSGGGGGDSGDDGGEVKSKSIAIESEELSAFSPDVIILDVKGMTCGGCAASVKRILENQPNVSSANVILETETAIVLPVPEVKGMENWQQQLGETLAKHLTNCGFKSNLRGQGAIEGNIA